MDCAQSSTVGTQRVTGQKRSVRNLERDVMQTTCNLCVVKRTARSEETLRSRVPRPQKTDDALRYYVMLAPAGRDPLFRRKCRWQHVRRACTPWSPPIHCNVPLEPILLERGRRFSRLGRGPKDERGANRGVGIVTNRLCAVETTQSNGSWMDRTVREESKRSHRLGSPRRLRWLCGIHENKCMAVPTELMVNTRSKTLENA